MTCKTANTNNCLNQIEEQYQALPIGATMTVILGIETSCDETAAAVVVDGHRGARKRSQQPS